MGAGVKLLDFLDRRDQRRLERYRIQPPRPRDNRMLVGLLFFVGYYALVTMLMVGRELPPGNETQVKDAMLVLGPVVGVIAQALFRTDVKDEIATQNTGEFARAITRQAEATTAAAATMPAPIDAAGNAADAVADAAADKADEIKDGGKGNVAD